MAQRSKKDQIADAALPLFIQKGIKGTSIDMVVKASGVSKPTVYNHFPDKSHLMTHVVERWLHGQPPAQFRAKTESGLIREFVKSWFSEESVRLYGLFMSERDRAGDAARLFLSAYDKPWRDALRQKAAELELDAEQLNRAASHTLLTCLLA